MAKEIERKFLIDMSKLVLPNNGVDIRQGYIETVTKTAVRVRVKGDKAYLTLKGENQGATRAEFEYEIPVDDAEEILAQLCQKPYIAKTRYEISVGEHVWEVDIFAGENQGLVVAEIELTAEDETFIKPEWVMAEVSDDARYYNSCLLSHPYSQW